MKDTFSEYKPILEQNLMNITYLYDGDVISSTNECYSEIKNNNLRSPIFIINSITDIYNKSFKNMISISKEFVLPEESITRHSLFGSNIIDLISDLGIKPMYIFTSEKGVSLYGVHRIQKENKPLPSYFYSVDRYLALNFDVYYSPLIEELENETVIYVVDKSFQSVVYSIQNMDYRIEEISKSEFKHSIDYKFYNCSFNSYKITIKNISKIREDKINQILNDN